MKRKLLESLYIRENQNSSMNLDNGLRSNPTWVTLDTHNSNSYAIALRKIFEIENFAITFLNYYALT